MSLIIREITARSILSRSGIGGITYTVNPYVGCLHGCTYCYATFMKKYTGHAKPWGTFVDAKVNAPALLRKQLTRAAPGTVILSSVTDPYQPAEKRFGLTRACLEVLSSTDHPVGVLTKSPLVLRDLDIFEEWRNLEVGLTITTDDEGMRRLFEPKAPPISERLRALETLHARGIATYVFIGPLLPSNPERLAEQVLPYADRILIDRMNYASKTAQLYRKHGLHAWLDRDHIDSVIERLQTILSGKPTELC